MERCVVFVEMSAIYSVGSCKTEWSDSKIRLLLTDARRQWRTIHLDKISSCRPANIDAVIEHVDSHATGISLEIALPMPAHEEWEWLRFKSPEAHVSGEIECRR